MQVAQEVQRVQAQRVQAQQPGAQEAQAQQVQGRCLQEQERQAQMWQRQQGQQVRITVDFTGQVKWAGELPRIFEESYAKLFAENGNVTASPLHRLMNVDGLKVSQVQSRLARHKAVEAQSQHRLTSAGPAPQGAAPQE